MAIAASFPTIRPSLLLDFANSGVLDPRVTFSRSTTATYYDGVTTAKAEENLLPYSQEFNQSVWSKLDSTVTADATTAPDSTSTADTFTISNTGGSGLSFLQTPVTLQAASHTVSVYVKKNTADWFFINFGQFTSPATSYWWFDVATGVVGAGSGHSIENAGNGWYRCIVPVTISGPDLSGNLRIGVSTGDAVYSYTLDGSLSVYLWGAQLEQRSAVTAYTPTTTQPITNYIPVLQTAAANVARFDHVPADNPTTGQKAGEALGLLIEEQRTNLLTYSADFGNAAWTANATSITPDSTTAPDGTLAADTLVEDTASNTHSVYNSFSGVTAGTTVTLSVYAKYAGRQLQLMVINAAGTRFAMGRFDLVSGTYVGNGRETTYSVIGNSITSVGNGWYRCALTVATSINDPTRARFYLIDSSLPLNQESYTGDGYSGVYLWGAQLEAGAFATSYIATTSATVTRNADEASMTGTNFSSWYNAGEGTLYAQSQTFEPAGSLGGIVSLNNGGSSDVIQLYYGNTGNVFEIVAGNVTQSAGSTTRTAANTFASRAGTYKVNDVIQATNGALGLLDTVALIPTAVNQLQIGGVNANPSLVLNGTIKKIAYYPERLTDANLQALTA